MPEWLFTPLGEVLVCALFESAALVWLYQSRRRPALIAAIAVPLIGAGLVVADLLHESPREAVDRTLSDLRRGFLNRDAKAVAAAVSPDCECDGLPREALSASLDALVPTLTFEVLRITRRSFQTVSDQRIVVRVTALSVVSAPVTFAGRTTTTWELTFEPQDGRWLMAEIRAVDLNGRPWRLDRLL